MNKYNALDETIEKVLFNKDQLAELKGIIKQLNEGNLSTREVKACIIKQKSQNLEKLIELIPHSVKNLQRNSSLKESEIDPSINDKLSELQERNDFLEKIGIKVNYLVNKLNTKLQA